MRLQTTSVLPSEVTAMPCDGSEPSGTSFFPAGSGGFLMRWTSLCVAKSTTANPLRPLIWTKIHFVEPSGLLANAIGRTPRASCRYHAGSSVCVSITLTVLPTIDPATTYLPSGVTYGLWMLPLVGTVNVIDTQTEEPAWYLQEDLG